MTGRSRWLAVSGSTLLVLLAIPEFAAAQILAEEAIGADEFATRCASGEFTLLGDLRVDGGSASLGECFVTVGSFRLEIQHVDLSISGTFNISAQPDGELNVEDSRFIQSDKVTSPLNIIFRPHRSHVENTVIDSVGIVTVGSGAADNGRNIVQSCRFRSRTAFIHIGSSGRGVGGRTEVRDSELRAGAEISIDASPLAPHGVGDVLVEGNTIVSQGTMIIDTGEDGRTRVRRNGGGVDGAKSGEGILSAGTMMIFSGAGGQTRVDDNRLLAEESMEIFSGARTTAARNNFSDSGSILIHGPRCRARDNIPEVRCTVD